MGGVFAGFGTIGILIGVGFLLAHLGVVDLHGQRTLSSIAFFVASPALLLTVLESADLGEVFSGQLVATAGAVAVVVAAYLVIARVRGYPLGATVVGAMTTGYVNAGNLGLPIAAYALGDAALVAPTLLLQLLLLQPLALTLLDHAISPTRLTVFEVASRPFKNPITIGSIIGVVLAATDAELPTVVHDSLGLIGGMAVPSMLFAYGIALRLGPLPGRGVPPAELATAVGLKMIGQPIAAYLLGRFVVGLDDHTLLAVTVIAALPTAQNVFVIATRYKQAELLARDAIFVSTLTSVPVVLAIAALLT